MRIRRLSILLLILVIFVGLAISRLGVAQQPVPSSPQTTAAQSQTQQPEQAVAYDGLTTFKKLAELLTSVGVKADEAKLIDGTMVDTTRIAHVRWNAYIGAPDFVEPNTILFPAGREITVLDRIKGKGPMSRHRFITLMADDLLIAAVDTNANLLWWTQVQDPRVLRGEWLDEKGQMAGAVVHRSRPEFFVEVPDRNIIRELRFYRIKLTGTDYALELINAIPF